MVRRCHYLVSLVTTICVLSCYSIQGIDGFVASSSSLPPSPNNAYYEQSWSNTIRPLRSKQLSPPSRFRLLLSTTTCTRTKASSLVTRHETANGDDNDEQVTSFSKRSESPLGVRRRVKAVLAKAKSRTGIRNSSEDDDDYYEREQEEEEWTSYPRGQLKTKQQTASNIVADAASIGGLGDGSVELALEYQRLPQPPSVKDPASTISPVIKNNKNPEEELLIVAPQQRLSPKRFSTAEVDAIRADVPAAYADPLPFTLPILTQTQKQLLVAGERIQEQSKMGGEGSGYVVLDVKAPPYVVWECLLDFESYPTTIPTVRDVQFYSSENLKSGYFAEKPLDPSTGRELRHYGTPSTTRAAFILSKFRLNIAAIHKYRPHPDGHYMVFTLDPECTNVVLKSAKGIWHTQSNPDGRGEVRFVNWSWFWKQICLFVNQERV